MMGAKGFMEVFIDTTLAVAKERYVKGLSGLIKNYTGIDSRYEITENKYVYIKTINSSIDEAANQIPSKVLHYKI